ncbi:MAG: 4'-phosphopantetheinyl transferase superfamily protein [Elusimicrobia bacterium]|nr:4'-phosphopantetheinyl transferase superfamily protein [Elusimicrobiota bacterium]
MNGHKAGQREPLLSASANYRLGLCLAQEAAELLHHCSDWLTDSERAVLDSLKTEKRRRDWLAGRIAAKRALGEGQPKDIEIANAESGRPYAELPGGRKMNISISHCEAGGLGAAASSVIGVDWEAIRTQTPAVIGYYATAREQESLRSPEDQIRLWTAKEAVFKLLSEELNHDLREIELLAAGKLSLSGQALKRWEKLGRPSIRLDHGVYAGACISVAYI